MFNKIYDKIKKFFKENYKFLICLALIFAFFRIELPYVIYTPGGNINLNDRIVIEDSENSKGSLNMAYVTVYRASVPFILLSYILPNWDLTDKSDITADNQSLDEKFELDKIMMETSIDSATLLAYEKAGESIEIKEETLNIVYIAPEAKTDLATFDIIQNVDGNILTSDELYTYIASKNVGDTITMQVLRDGKVVDVTSEVILLDGEKKVGILFVPTYEFITDPKIEISSESDESGPSGGLMLTLSIYDKLIDEDITGGKKIVGTGTIDTNGEVGKIDGVKYKILGSKDADIFLCPEENYEEAIKVKEENNLDIQIYSVKTFDEATSLLEDIK